MLMPIFFGLLVGFKWRLISTGTTKVFISGTSTLHGSAGPICCLQTPLLASEAPIAFSVPVTCPLTLVRAHPVVTVFPTCNHRRGGLWGKTRLVACGQSMIP